MTISLCKHSFPDLSRDRAFRGVGDCRGCGITYGQARAAYRPAQRRPAA